MKKTLALFLPILIFLSPASQATIVRVETNFGNFDVNLYDANTPQTVANFLAYVNDGDYTNVIFHRSVNGFIVQSGGFAYAGAWPAQSIAADPSVINEPVYSNVRGTIAMAKLANQPNSATNQWFINLADNSANLDNQNSGFTVFGEISNSDMSVIDSIAGLSTYNLGGAFTDIPLMNFDINNDPTDANLVIINNIQVIDSATNTAAGLNPPLSTRAPNVEPGTSSSGGGALHLLFLGIVGIIFSVKKKFQ